MAVFKTSCEIPENLPISFPAYHHSTEGESPDHLVARGQFQVKLFGNYKPLPPHAGDILVPQ